MQLIEFAMQGRTTSRICVSHVCLSNASRDTHSTRKRLRVRAGVCLWRRVAWRRGGVEAWRAKAALLSRAEDALFSKADEAALLSLPPLPGDTAPHNTVDFTRKLIRNAHFTAHYYGVYSKHT